MAMFGVSGRESYDSLYGVLNQAPDTTALEREQAPGVFAGSMTEAIGTGVYRGWSRGAATLGNVATPALRPIAKSIDEIFGSKTDDWLLGEQEKANRALTESKLDPKTNGAASQLLYGLSDVLTTVIATRGYAPAAGGLFGVTQAQIGMAEGLDTNTALAKGAIEGLGLGVGVALAPAYGSTLTQKLLTGAGINTAIGIGTRAPVSVLLNARGYPEMAKQYAPFDATSLATDLVLGAAFGGLYRAPVKGKAPVQVPPEAIAPSTVDAALTANQARHAEIDAAPGVPVDTRSRQAHNAALDSAVESLAMGRDVNVEALLKDAGFIGKRPDFDALKVIADELDKAGAADVVAKVRAIEAEARSRGLYVEPDTLDSVVLSEKPAAVQVAGQAGRESDVRIGDDVVPTRLMLVEAGDVAATMNKAENQYRDRTRLASEQQIQDIAARLDSRLLMDAPVMDYGAPVLSADGVVIGGNGRAAAIGLAYERGSAASYRDALRAEFGDAVDGMQRPMLVRVLQRDVDVARAAILSNEGQALRMSALEQAKVDAERLGDFRAFEFGDDGAVDLVSNMGFIRAWAEQMPPGQRAAIMDADGKLSAEGAGRLRNAILYRAYGDSPTLARLVEATDPGSRNIAAALTRVAPAVADAREAIDRGDLYPMGLHDDLVASVEKLDALRRQGMSVTDWMKQIDAFGDGMTAEARLLVQFMDANIRAPRAISDGVLGFYARLNEAGNPKQGSMFEASLPDKGRMLTLALDDPGPMYSRLQTETPAFKAWFGDSKVVDADGKPLVVYHGTASDFSAFSKDVEAKHIELPGFYFTPETAYADRFAESAGKEFRDDDGYIAGSEGANVVPVYLSIRNPATIDLGDSVFGGAMTSAKEVKKMLDAAKAAGHDGAIIKDWADGSGPIQYVAFTSTQIKSATGNRGTFDPADADITYGRGAGGRSTATDLVTTLRAMFGKDADRLISTGKLRIVQSVSDLPGSGHPSDVGGMFWQGRAWIVADNTSLSQIRGRVLHEIGEHAGMEQMLGPDLYAETLRRIEAKVATDPVFAEARALAEARANKPEHVPAETLAYLVENAPELPVVRRVLAMVRQWLYRTTGGRFVDLTQADLQMMAVASLRRAARLDEVAARGDAPWYMTLFQGTPHVFQPEPGAPLGRLRWDKINTGEGAQVFGYGHYLAQQEWIARTRYRDRLVKRKANEATLRIPHPRDPDAYILLDQNNDPAWRIGDRVVHTQMGGEEQVLADAAAQVARYGYAQARKTFESIAKNSKESGEELISRIEKHVSSLPKVEDWLQPYLDIYVKALLEDGATRDSARVVLMDAASDAGVNLKQYKAIVASRDTVFDEIGRATKQTSTLRAEIEMDQARLRALDEVTVLADDADNYPLTRDLQRVLRPDITEVRPEPPKGALYGKYIPDEAWARMMIWDAPLSKQPENVKAAFEKLGIKARDLEWTQEPNAKRWHAKPESGLDVLITETPGLGPHSDPYFTMFVNKKEMGTYASINEAKAEADFRYGDAGMDGEAAYRKLADAVDNADIKHDIVSAATKELLQRRGLDMNGMDDYIENTSPRSYAEELASVILHQAGVPGHRFLDGETRAAGWDSPKARFNVVLYSDELGRVAWEARNNDTEWVTANGRGQVFKETDELLDRSFYVAKVDGEDVGQAFTVEEATRMVERELNGQLYSRSGDGDKIPAPDPIEDTTLPNARLLADQADEEIATANELSQGFLPAVECAMQVGG